MRATISGTLVILFLIACTHSPVNSIPPVSPNSTPTEQGTASSAWIEVVLEEQVAILWNDEVALKVLPIASGIGDSPGTTTYTGVYEIATMYRGPEQTAPGVYVRDIVIFDWDHGNGFHSLPLDENGHILDATIGIPASAGCIRVRDSAVLYEFAYLGMKVVIR
jgi:hypothetical protein